MATSLGHRAGMRVSSCSAVNVHTVRVRPLVQLARQYRATSVQRATVSTRATSSEAAEGIITTASSPAITTTAAPPPPITLTDSALTHLKKMKAESADNNVLLRVGVKSGGCSGMSYVMDFESRDKVTADDMIVAFDSGAFELVVEPKALLYLFGMSLDYSDALIGGGFKFINPNAAQSCGCGQSFGV